MANILQSRFCNIMVVCITIVAFTTATLTPLPLMAAGVNLDFNAINFGAKIEKIYEKIKKCINKGETNKIVGHMFDFKTEVEHYTTQKIDINTYIDQVQIEAKARGQKVDDKYVKAIKKEFGKLE